MADLRERLEAALQLVHDLAQGKRSRTLSVPARPDYDPDLVLSSVLREALDHPERLMGEPRQQVDAEHRICEHGRDAFADDCGMCDRAGTNYATKVKP